MIYKADLLAFARAALVSARTPREEMVAVFTDVTRYSPRIHFCVFAEQHEPAAPLLPISFCSIDEQRKSPSGAKFFRVFDFSLQRILYFRHLG
jgi:hypothetical protein